MTVHADLQGLPETTGTVYYTKPSKDELYSYVYKHELDSKGEELQRNGQPFSNLERIETEVQVRDMRQVADTFSLKRNGVILRKLVVPGGIDWANKDEVSIAPLRSQPAGPSMSSLESTGMFLRNLRGIYLS